MWPWLSCANKGRSICKLISWSLCNTLQKKEIEKWPDFLIKGPWPPAHYFFFLFFHLPIIKLLIRNFMAFISRHTSVVKIIIRLAAHSPWEGFLYLPLPLHRPSHWPTLHFHTRISTSEPLSATPPRHLYWFIHKLYPITYIMTYYMTYIMKLVQRMTLKRIIWK